MQLAERVKTISPSPTLGIDARAKQMKSAGIPVISFGAGEPDFDTPQHIKQEGIEAIRRGFTKYTPTPGIPELKQAICDKLEKDNGLIYEPFEIIVSVGAKHALYNAFQVLCNPGDEVILLAPYWVSYAEQVRLAGAAPVVVETSAENGFIPDVEAIAARLTPRSKVLVLNSPNNPTGAVYPRSILERVAELAVSRDLVVISDEIYEKLVYGETEHVSIAVLGPEIRNRTLVVNGVSKTYAMTGWRIGYAAGDRRLIKAMADLQSHSTSNPASMAQMASLAALTGTQEPVEEMRREFAVRRDLMVAGLNRIPGVECHLPQGAFYIFARVSSLFGRRAKGGTVIDGSEALAEYLLTEGHVAVVPGTAFGAQDYIRLSYVTSREKVEAGLAQIRAAVDQLS
ncbi:MAG: pyridoxal phosphate-dependent aminotransferase [Syntrophothermus sp.]